VTGGGHAKHTGAAGKGAKAQAAKRIHVDIGAQRLQSS
jgi:hypothetical protein